ncbi:MAG: DUF5615 family PIN-like protein [Chloroflexi bacterium]|nr:DUF5615 family PIN-like protein [Chloroflexota bacterium]
MKLLLDEMWPPEVAVQLRRRGHDVVAVAERSELRGQPDAAIFTTAQVEGRAIVTENVVDYRPLAVNALQRGDTHRGLVFTSNRRFPRHDPRTAGHLATALDELLSTEREALNLEYWLS